MPKITSNELNERQNAILAFVEANESVSIGQIFEHIQKDFEKITRITVSRDLEKLLKFNLIEKQGESKRTIVYKISSQYSTLKKIDVEKYFSTDADQREIREKFNFDIFDKLSDIFTMAEKDKLSKLNEIYKKKMQDISPDALKKEIERLNIDFSWKSSKIEGNTYSLLETEQLIKNQQEATGHTKEDATMILNHKKTLEYIGSNKNEFRSVSVPKIENIHSLLVDDLNVTKNLRKTLVGITGTNYKPLDNEFQIKEALEKTCKLVNETKDVFEKAVALMLLIAYIQPFVDGNKRTSRLSGNAILQSFDCCPLSYRSMDEIEYKKAILLFYEQNNIAYFKELFLKQFEFAVENYFG
ncbi:MAG TPA: cell filamentation protein Fic [Candidatus Moranbacteria bacterium]|nr:cell filamentation protein Fic [Candidatus Moranbacteria bacterium]HAT74484.1 cell filamentation protein Fic [Candidatus Moranbacteria bacterium]